MVFEFCFSHSHDSHFKQTNFIEYPKILFLG